MTAIASVATTIVTYNSDLYIARCLEFLLLQDYPDLHIIVVDNASADTTLSVLQGFEPRISVIRNSSNIGFAAAQNQAIAASDSAWILTLNPDVRLTRTFISELVQAGESRSDIGTVCGKLLAMGPDFAIPEQPIFDSTGIFFTRNLRHLDRGSRSPDRGQYDTDEFVFGATGAAALYRRSMIDDVSLNGEFFDSEFFAYREDADVAWRAQLLGWRCLYTPRAVAYHVRRVLPENRRSVPAVLNMHSVKNRFLMRIKNMTPDLYRRLWFPIAIRDLTVAAGCLLYEFRSLPAFWYVIRRFPAVRRKRLCIMSRRRASDEYVAAWFSDNPASVPACEL